MKDSIRRWAPIVSALGGVVLAVGSPAAYAQVRKGTVAAQSLPVYAEMSTDSDQVATLQHGAAVQILLSVTAGNGSWCSVANANEATKLGYVECTELAIVAAPGGTAIASASGIAAKGPPPSREQMAWALAASAIASTANREGTSTLAAEASARARELLAAGWGVRRRDDLFRALNELDEGTERAMFSKMGERSSALSETQFEKMVSRLSPQQANALKVAREYYPRYQGQSLLGWDYARYINVCRWGVAAGYMTPDEAWPLIMNAARTLQSTFGSWQEFGQNYMVGRKFVPPVDIGTPMRSAQAAYNWLISNSASPWQRIPWNLSLN